MDDEFSGTERWMPMISSDPWPNKVAAALFYLAIRPSTVVEMMASDDDPSIAGGTGAHRSALGIGHVAHSTVVTPAPSALRDDRLDGESGEGTPGVTEEFLRVSVHRDDAPTGVRHDRRIGDE